MRHSESPFPAALAARGKLARHQGVEPRASAFARRRSITELMAYMLVDPQGFEPWCSRLKVGCLAAQPQINRLMALALRMKR